VILDSRERERINKAFSRREDRRKEWDTLLKTVCERQKTDIIFVYFDLLYEDLGLEAGVDLFMVSCCEGESTLVMENLNLEGQQLVSRFSEDFAFDLIITLKSGYTTMPFFNFFTLEYTSWSRMPTRSIPISSPRERYGSTSPRSWSQAPHRQESPRSSPMHRTGVYPWTAGTGENRPR